MTCGGDAPNATQSAKSDTKCNHAQADRCSEHGRYTENVHASEGESNSVKNWHQDAEIHGPLCESGEGDCDGCEECMTRIEFTLIVEVDREAKARLYKLQLEAEDNDPVNPEWKAGKAFCRWWKKRGVPMKMVKWSCTGAGDTMKSERQPSDFHGLSEKGSNLSESDRLGGGSPFATCSHCGRETLRAYLVNIEPGDIACSPVWVCRKCAEGYGWYSQGGAWHHNELRPYGEGSDD